jgi:GNAT superfamily N-acetyltransferase
MIELAITDSDDKGLRDGILKAIDAYNDAKMGRSGDYRPLVIPIRESPAGPVIGGMTGYTWAQWLFIELLVLPDSMRGKGLGTRLMKMAEAEAIRRGCVGVWLDTHSFQARPFYEKLGYSVFGVLEDFPPGHTRYYLRKSLAAVPRK